MLQWLLDLFKPKPKPPVAQPPSKPTPAWFDDFNGPAGTLPSPWQYVLADPKGIWSHTATNYPHNGSLDGNSNLVIAAVKERVPGYAGTYTTAYLRTKGKLEAKYGRFEARIKLPAGNGLDATFWLLGSSFNKPSDWPGCGEIDIIETRDGLTGSGLHGTGLDLAAVARVANVTDDFHTYWLDWRPGIITIGVDGVTTATWTPKSTKARWPFDDQPMHVALSLGVTKPDAATVFPARMLVDWIRYTP